MSLRTRRATRSPPPTTSASARQRSDAETRRYEPAFQDAAAALLGQEEAFIFAALAHLGDDGTDAPAVKALVAALVDDLESGTFNEQWATDFRALTETVAAVGGDGVAASLGVTFGLTNTRVARAITARADKLADYVGQSSADGIVAAFRASKDAKETVRQLAARIRQDVYSEDTNNIRAMRVARTETVGAYNLGEHLAAQESGVVATKTWLTQSDDKVRESHAELEGMEIPIEETFPNGCAYPGDQSADPEEVIQCRCSLLYNTDAGDSGDAIDAEAAAEDA